MWAFENADNIHIPCTCANDSRGFKSLCVRRLERFSVGGKNAAKTVGWTGSVFDGSQSFWKRISLDRDLKDEENMTPDSWQMRENM